MEGVNSIETGITRAMYCASCPAPLGIRCQSPGACRSAAASSAAMVARSQGAGMDLLMLVSVATQRSRRLLSCTQARRHRSSRSSTGTSMSRNWNRMSAWPGMMLGAPGSTAMRPQVQVLRSPQIFGNSWSIIASSRTAARPASFRSAMVVPPAWSCIPSMVMRHCQMPTMPVTTPARSPAFSSWVPCSMCISKKARWRSFSSCIRGSPASPAAASASRSGVPSLRLRLRSISASLRAPMIDLLPRKPPSKCPSSSAKAATSTGSPARASATPAMTPSAPSSQPA